MTNQWHEKQFEEQREREVEQFRREVADGKHDWDCPECLNRNVYRLGAEQQCSCGWKKGRIKCKCCGEWAN